MELSEIKELKEDIAYVHSEIDYEISCIPGESQVIKKLLVEINQNLYDAILNMSKIIELKQIG